MHRFAFCLVVAAAWFLFTADQVRAAAARSITPERAIRLEAIPQAAAASAPAEAAASQN